MADEPIQILRHLGAVPGPPATLLPGQLAYNINGDTLYIGTAVPANVRTLVSSGAGGRFLPMSGGTLTGSLAVGSTTTPAHLDITGAVTVHGGDGTFNLESEDDPGVNASVWSLWARGTTTTGSAVLTMTPPAAPITGTDTPRLTVHANGNVDVAGQLKIGPAGVFPNITATDVAGAINELQSHISSLQSGERRVAFYDALTNQVRDPLSGTLVANQPLSAVGNEATPASRAGWYLVVMGSGTGVAPIAGAALHPNDRISSDGVTWSHQSMGMAAATASNTAFTPVASPAIAGTNVQTAIEQLNTAALRAVVVDTTRFSGNGTSGSAITLLKVDNGEY